MKKLMAWLLVSAMMLGTSVVASAAEVIAGSSSSVNSQDFKSGYTVKGTGDSVQFIKGGSVISTRELETSVLTLTNSEDGGAAIQFTDVEGDVRKVSLGAQNAVTITGKITSLILPSTLSKDVAVFVPSGANIRNMKISSQTKVGVDGIVTNLEIRNGKARVSASGDASISTVKTVNQNAISGVSSSRIEMISDKNYSSSNNSNYNYSSNDPNWTYSSTRDQWYNDIDGRWYDEKSDYDYRYNDRYYDRYYNDDSDWRYDSGRGQWYNYEDGRYYDSKSDYYDYNRNSNGHYSVWGADSDWNSEIGVSRVSTSGDKVTFNCDVSGATIYWNDARVGTTSSGENTINVYVKRSNRLTVEKRGYGEITVSVDGRY